MINYEFPPVGGGGGIVTYYLAKNYVKNGHKVKIITSQFDGLPKDETLEGFQVHRVPVFRKNPNVCQVYEMLSFTISATVECLKYAKRFEPHVVHVFFGIPSGPVAYLLKKIYGYPYVVFLGGRDVPRKNPEPSYYRLIYGLINPAIKAIWKNASAVVACSDGLRRLALKTDSEVDFSVIPDGIDLSKFTFVERKVQNNTVRILTVGRLIPRKGYQFLISAIPEIAKNANNDFELEVVGDGPMKTQLISLVSDLQLEHKVNFVGTVSYEKLVQHYNNADIFVLPSLAEGMPLVALEAMATGLPIIASKVQGTEDLVKSGINGYLVQPGNIKQLAERITKLINEPELRIQMGRESRDNLHKYSWENIAQSYLRIFERIVA